MNRMDVFSLSEHDNIHLRQVDKHPLLTGIDQVFLVGSGSNQILCVVVFALADWVVYFLFYCIIGCDWVMYFLFYCIIGCIIGCLSVTPRLHIRPDYILFQTPPFPSRPEYIEFTQISSCNKCNNLPWKVAYCLDIDGNISYLKL